MLGSPWPRPCCMTTWARWSSVNTDINASLEEAQEGHQRPHTQEINERITSAVDGEVLCSCVRKRWSSIIYVRTWYSSILCKCLSGTSREIGRLNSTRNPPEEPILPWTWRHHEPLALHSDNRGVPGGRLRDFDRPGVEERSIFFVRGISGRRPTNTIHQHFSVKRCVSAQNRRKAGVWVTKRNKNNTPEEITTYMQK